MVGIKLGVHQIAVGLVKALFLVLFAAEGADRHDAGQNLTRDKVEAVHKGLHDFELGHGKCHQHGNKQQEQDDRHRDNPGQARAGLGHMENTAHAENRCVGDHAQQNNADHLYLLDIVGCAGDERCSGELVGLGV